MIDSWQTMRPLVTDFLPKALLAIACGGLIGVEREIRSKPAGFRTNILICLGSMLFMWLSAQVAMVVAVGRPADPGRIAAQVVAGIGFLGAGTILKDDRGEVRGLTTAAGVWLTAAIGVAAGMGRVGSAALRTALALIILSVLPKLVH